MKKNKVLIFVLAGLLLALAACMPAQATPPATSTATEAMVQVVIIPQTAGPTSTPEIQSPTPVQQYVRPESRVGNTPVVLTGDYASVIFFTDTGEPWGALLSRATREMKIGVDLPANVVAMLVFDVRENRNELVQVLANPKEETQLKVDNGGLLISIEDWSAYHVELGAPFEDAILVMREASLDLLADAIIDNRHLSDAGQLCLPANKEIGELFPCTRPLATIIPTMTPRP